MSRIVSVVAGSCLVLMCGGYCDDVFTFGFEIATIETL